MQSGWCVPCGGGGIRPAGDDPSSGDTMCAFPDKAALKAAVNACLSAVPSGEACCSTDANCADPSSARCGSAGCVDMPEWDVSLVTDMSGLFCQGRGILGVGYLAGDGHAYMFRASTIDWNSQVTTCSLFGSREFTAPSWDSSWNMRTCS